MPNFIQQLLQQAMKKKGGDLIAPVLNRSVGKLGPRDLPTRFTPTQPLRSFPGRPVQAPGLPSPPARVATKGVSPYAVGGTAVVGGGALGVGIAATDQIEGALNRVGPAVDRFFGQITPQAIQQFGKEQENKGWGGALEMATPLGFLAAPFIPNTRPSSKTSGSRPVGTQAVLNGKPVYWGGDDYGWQLLNGTGSSATLNSLNAPGTQGRFIQDTAPRSPGAAQGGGGGFSGAGSFAPIDPYAAQNREYERERARVEAMVKANPDMQKQAIADERAKVRDQGMAIWAAKYGAPGGLASQVKPGAVGYDAIQRGIGIQELPSLEKRAEFTWNQATQGPTPAVPMADAMLNPAGPGFIGGEGAPPVNFADPRFENMSPEEFQKLLNQYTKR